MVTKLIGKLRLLVVALSLVGMAVSGALSAETLAPGAPGATTTVDGHTLPESPEPFHGKIAPNAADSQPSWPAIVVPPAGRPTSC